MVLVSELRARGLEAHLSNTGEYRDGDFVVYPEIIRGNPLGAQRYCTWLLNLRPPLQDGQRFSWNVAISDDPLLTVNVIEDDLWWPLARRTKTVGVWEGKGRIDPRLVPDGAVQITREGWPTRQGLACFIRSLDYLISFDRFTVVNVEAVCSGVPVRLHDDGMWTREQVEATGFHPYGIAWKDDEMDAARDSVHLARDYYFGTAVPSFASTIDRFVAATCP